VALCARTGEPPPSLHPFDGKMGDDGVVGELNRVSDRGKLGDRSNTDRVMADCLPRSHVYGGQTFAEPAGCLARDCTYKVCELEI
jgi:hypothetical protein